MFTKRKEECTVSMCETNDVGAGDGRWVVEDSGDVILMLRQHKRKKDTNTTATKISMMII